jgi:hypothetical protein
MRGHLQKIREVGEILLRWQGSVGDINQHAYSETPILQGVGTSVMISSSIVLVLTMEIFDSMLVRRF